MKNRILIFTIFLGLNALGCRKVELEPRSYPTVSKAMVSEMEDGIQFSARITETTGDSILEYGFVWAQGSTPAISPTTAVVRGFKLPPGQRDFSFTVQRIFDTTATYFIRPFVRTASHTVYGLATDFQVSRLFASAELTGFEPSTADFGDSIYFKGNYLPPESSRYAIFFGDRPTSVARIASGEFVCRVPNGLPDEPVQIRVSIDDTTYTFNNAFTRRDFSSGFFPKTATFRDTLFLHGDFPVPNGSDGEYGVSLGGTDATIVRRERNLLVATVPDILNEPDLVVRVNYPRDLGTNFSYDSLFSLLPPVIQSLDVLAIQREEPFTLRGKNFHPDPLLNQLRINGKYVLISEASPTELIIDDFSIEVEKLVKHITLEIIQQKTEYYIVGPEEQTGVWQRWVEAPLEGVRNFLIFRSGGTIYAGYGESEGPNPQLYSSLYAYQPATGSWDLVSQFADASVLSQKRVWTSDAGTVYMIGRTGDEWHIYQFMESERNWSFVQSFVEASDLVNVFPNQEDDPNNKAVLSFRNGKIFIFNFDPGNPNQITFLGQHLDTSYQESQVLYFSGKVNRTFVQFDQVLINRNAPSGPYQKTYWSGGGLLEEEQLFWSELTGVDGDILNPDPELEIGVGIQDRDPIVLQENPLDGNAILGLGHSFPTQAFILPAPASARSLGFPDEKRIWVIHDRYLWSFRRE